MIKFEKDVKKLLPYDRKQYIKFLSNDEAPICWYGMSFQLPGAYENKEIELSHFLRVFEPLFESVISRLDNGSFWIVNHEDKDLDWFPNNDNTLIQLRSLFKEGNVPNTFRGALVFTKKELLDLSKDFICYPYSVFQKEEYFYKDLNISHAELQFIIKISGHLNIDFLSQNRTLLQEIVTANNSSDFVLKPYSGTFL